MRLSRLLPIGLLTLVLVQFIVQHRAVSRPTDLHRQRSKGAVVPYDVPESAIIKVARLAASNNNGTLILTFVRAEQLWEFFNFMSHVRKAGLADNLLTVALDKKAQQNLMEGCYSALHTFWEEGVQHAEHSTRSASSLNGLSKREYSLQLERDRWRFIAAILKAGLHIWLSDVRVVWIRRPPILSQIGQQSKVLPVDCDVAFASGSPSEAGNVTLTEDMFPSAALSLFQSTRGTIRWLEHLASNAHPLPGMPSIVVAGLNRCLPSFRGLMHPQWTEPGLGFDSKACPQWCLLPSTLFINGLSAFQQPNLRIVDTLAGLRTAHATHRAPRLQQRRESSAPSDSGIAILADWVRPTQLEYQLREFGLWRGHPKQGVQLHTRSCANDEPSYNRVGEKFLAYKELLINNGLSNTRCAPESTVQHDPLIPAADRAAGPLSSIVMPCDLR